MGISSSTPLNILCRLQYGVTFGFINNFVPYFNFSRFSARVKNTTIDRQSSLFTKVADTYLWIINVSENSL